MTLYLTRVGPCYRRLSVRFYRVSPQLACNILTSPLPDVTIPENSSFSEFTMQRFDSHRERIALVDASSGESYSFKQFTTNVRRVASGLTRLGFKKGDVFATYAPNIPEHIIFFHGVASIGGILTTVNPVATAYELARQLKQTRAQVLITTPPLAETAKEAAKQTGVNSVYVFGEHEGCLPYQSLCNNDGLNFPRNVAINSREDLLVLPCSSGTTGPPKAVMLTHHTVVSNLMQLSSEKLLRYSQNSVVLGLLPLFHAYGMVLFNGLYPMQGAKVVLLPQFLPELFLKTIQEYKVTVAPIVPPIAVFLAKHPMVEQYDLSSLREVFCGAAPLGKEVIDEIKGRLPHVELIRQGFGMTELSPGSHIDMNDRPRDGSVGVLVPNTECKVINISSGQALGPNETGEICVRGPQVMKGYLDNPEATADIIDSEGWLHTGDIGHYDEDEYFYIVDRLKELIKYKGFQVPPAELEDLLLSHPHIQDAAVIGIVDPVAGEVPKAFVVQTGHLTESDVQEYVAQKVAPYKKLRGGVEFLPEIPKAASGKILRRVLRDAEAKKSERER